MTRIFASHLLNDYSGSPKVLSQLLKGWADANYEVHLRTSSSTPGFLTGIKEVTYHDNHYRFHSFIPLRLVVLMLTQLWTFLSLLSTVKRNDLVYVNTILPFGAAVAGKIKGARVIYHIHETSVNPKIFKAFLLFWVKACSTEVIYVSNFLAREEPLDMPYHIIWNAIEDDFLKKAIANRKHSWEFGNVLMVSSLKRYKGVDEFVNIAYTCPWLHFDLVVNASLEDIEKYFFHSSLPDNLSVFPAQKDVHPFYQKADVVMNLSRPDEWKETFGLTALEAMIYGIPVIVPPEGGISEIVPNHVTGFHINGKNTLSISRQLRKLSTEPTYYQLISQQAAAHAATFSERQFLSQSLQIIAGEAS
jgi:glycosyltransferase involved in cell wall biosynthesis